MGFEDLEFDDDIEAIAKIPESELVWCEVKQKRKLKFHKKFICMCRYICENSEGFNTVENVIENLKWRTGRFKEIYVSENVTSIKTESIAFDKMDNTSFERFFHESVQVAMTYYFNHCTDEERDYHVENLLDFI